MSYYCKSISLVFITHFITHLIVWSDDTIGKVSTGSIVELWVFYGFHAD